MAHNSAVAGLEFDVTIISGRGLAAKDKKLFSKDSSDPYVEVYFEKRLRGRTKPKFKTLSPTWNQTLNFNVGASDASRILHNNSSTMSFRIYDYDRLSDDDFMGVVNVPIPGAGQPTTGWYRVETGDGRLYCIDRTQHGKYKVKKAKGELQVKIAVSARKSLHMVRGNTHMLNSPQIQVACNWTTEKFGPNGKGIDLDTSCVAVGRYGNILMHETVYFGDLINSNGSIRHSGDCQDGALNESIFCDLANVSQEVIALYFILTVATPRKTLKDVRSALVTISTPNGYTIGQFQPALAGDHTALFLMRLAREGYGWNMAIIEDTDHTARDFGSLIPEIKGYTRDLVPGMNINPRERVAIMRKGGGIRIKDYSRGQPPTNVTFGLAWDITRGRNIDLDASAICLDENLQVLDTVYFKQLRSRDGSIWHSGDERTGYKKGDDEKISVNLPAVHPAVKYIGFTITSYSGQKLDDISRAKCHLFDTHSGVDLASYNMTNCRTLGGYTGLLLACLYRETPTEWNLRIIGEPAHGRQAHRLHGNFQNFLHRVPPPQPSIPSEPEIIVSAMPEFVPMQEEGDIVVGPSVPGGVPLQNQPPLPKLQVTEVR